MIMKRIDCKKKCKKTSALRSSKYCEGFAEYKNGKIEYSCEKNTRHISKKEANFYECDFYDMEEYSQCYKCPLECKNNKSIVKKMKSNCVEKAKKDIKDFSSKIPVSSEALSVALTNLDSDLSEEDKRSIKLVNLASDTLRSAMSGGKVNMSLVKRLGKMAKKLSKS